VLAAALSAPVVAAELLRLDADTTAAILSHGPWPVAVARDASNRASGRPEAIAFGEVLFHSTRLSTVGGMRCASCHEPWRALADGRALGQGAESVHRNTPSLFNVALNPWFGWDGARDNLWSQSVRPLLDRREMRASPAHVATLIREDAELRQRYVVSFGAAPPADDDEAVLVDVGKALAAFQETLVSARTPFDEFRDALQRGDGATASAYPPAAQRGAILFEGRARCAACHAGPTFSDGRFHRSLIESRGADGRPDEGRAAGLRSLRADPRNLLGIHNDGDGEPRARVDATRRAVAMVDPVAGTFRTPGLREVAATGPYMHDGSVANLCDALRPHATPAAGGGAPDLSLDERRDLVAFLRSLSASPEAPLVDAAIYRCR
jgi:cytochrome c peroxidase